MVEGGHVGGGQSKHHAVRVMHAMAAAVLGSLPLRHRFMEVQLLMMVPTASTRVACSRLCSAIDEAMTSDGPPVAPAARPSSKAQAPEQPRSAADNVAEMLRQRNLDRGRLSHTERVLQTTHAIKASETTATKV